MIFQSCKQHETAARRVAALPDQNVLCYFSKHGAIGLGLAQPLAQKLLALACVVTLLLDHGPVEVLLAGKMAEDNGLVHA
jgi:hypothetical protein